MKREKHILLTGITLIAMLLPAACGGEGGDAPSPSPPPLGTGVSMAAELSGNQVVPPVATAAGASGVLVADTGTGAASGRVTITTPPASTIIAVHVQEGARGTNGSIVITLENSGGGVWSVPSDKVLSQAQVESFLTGNLYFNVRTSANPSGELRGQIDSPAQ